MNVEDITKPNLLTTYGLSCFETLVIRILTLKGFDIKKLFAASLSAFSELYNYFFVQNNSFAYFDTITKIHDFLRARGVIGIENVNGNICGIDNDNFLFVNFDKENMKKYFGITPWRDDHYLIFIDKNDSVCLINDRPLKKIILKKEDFTKLKYRTVQINIKRYPSLEDYEILEKSLQNTCQKIYRENNVNMTSLTTNNISFGLRDMLFIFAILLKRLNCFFDSKYAVAFNKYISIIEKYSMEINYKLLRKTEIEMNEAFRILEAVNKSIQEIAQISSKYFIDERT